MKKIPYAFFLLAPLACFAFGLLLNGLVMAANHLQMPVLMPGGVCPAEGLDPYHVCMDAATHLKWLADWFSYQHYIASPGDLFITIGEVCTYPSLLVWATLLVQKVNLGR